MRTICIRRFLLIFIALTFFVECGFISSSEDRSSNDFPPNIVSGKAVSDSGAGLEIEQPIEEVVSLRTANSKHYKLSDGTYVAYAFSEVIHRENTFGKWQEIDNELFDTNDNYSTKDGYVSFGKDYGNESVLKINSGNYSISISPLKNSDSSKAVVENPQNNKTIKTNDETELDCIIEKTNKTAKIYYKNIIDGIDVEYLLLKNDIKENIIVNKYTGLCSFDCQIDLKGLKPQLDNNTILLLDDTTAELKYVIPSPYMYDSSGAVSYEVIYQLSETKDGGYALKITADTQWLSSDERVYPVTIDPTVYAQTINKDSHVSHNNPSTNFGNWQYLRVQNDNNDQCFGLLKIDMPSIPSNATISSAYLDVSWFSVYTYMTSMYVNIYGVNSNWFEYSVNWNTTSSNSFMDTNPSDTGTLSCSTFAYYKNRHINTTNIVKQWYSGRANYGIAIKYAGGTCKSLPLESKESNNTTMHPRYRIYYYLSEDLPFEDGDYYIVNAKLGKLMQIDNNDSSNNYGSENALMKLSPFNSTATYQKWHISYLHNGYYKITSVKSGKVLSVREGQEHSVNVSLVQQSYSLSNRQQWVISKSNGGRCIIKAASSINASNNLVLSAGVNQTSVLQKVYTNNSIYSDEWRIIDVNGRWYNIEDQNIGYWETSPKIWISKAGANISESTEQGFEYAKNIWNDALGLSMTITTNQAQADIEYYYGTYAEIAALGFFGPILQSNHGNTVYESETYKGLIPVDGQLRRLYRINKIRGYIIVNHDDPPEYIKHVILHEMGHALGWHGHPAFRLDWVMVSGDGSNYPVVLSEEEVLHIKRVY